MAAHTSTDDIQELRTQLEASRWKMYDGIHHLEDQFNLSRRIRSEFGEHPVKWIVISAGVGLVAARLLPLLLGGGKKGWAGSVLSPLVRAAAVAAMPLLAQKASEYMTNHGLPNFGLDRMIPGPSPLAPASPPTVPHTHPA